MMKKLLLVGLASLVLTACGGGGSGGGSNSNHMTIANGSKSIDLVPEELKVQVKKLKTITLDTGAILDLSEMPVGYLEKDVGNGKIKGINGIYYAFGTWIPYNLKYNEHGLPTNHTLENEQRAAVYTTPKIDLPKSGVAIYEGDSMGVVTRGKLRLEVDFYRNALSGKIYDRHLPNGKSLENIVLREGYIVHRPDGGAGFQGPASYYGVTGSYDGNFAGPKADEVMGLITKDGAIYVGFGGKRGELSNVKPNTDITP